MNTAKEFDLKEFLDAVEKNGYEYANGALFRIKFVENTRVIIACAAGQGLINYGIISEEDILSNWTEAMKEAENYIRNNFPKGLYSDIYNMNDSWGIQPDKIAQFLKKRWLGIEE